MCNKDARYIVQESAMSNVSCFTGFASGHYHFYTEWSRRYTMDIGNKIQKIRAEQGMTQAEFADKFHVSRQTEVTGSHAERSKGS